MFVSSMLGGFLDTGFLCRGAGMDFHMQVYEHLDFFFLGWEVGLISGHFYDI